MMALGPLGLSSCSDTNRKDFGVGLQLYTIRDAMGADVPGSLEKVSLLGYRYVELASYSDGKFYGYAPSEFKKMVDDLGMEVLSSHTQVEAAGITLDNAKNNHILKEAEIKSISGMKIGAEFIRVSSSDIDYDKAIGFYMMYS